MIKIQIEGTVQSIGTLQYYKGMEPFVEIVVETNDEQEVPIRISGQEKLIKELDYFGDIFIVAELRTFNWKGKLFLNLFAIEVVYDSVSPPCMSDIFDKNQQPEDERAENDSDDLPF